MSCFFKKHYLNIHNLEDFIIICVCLFQIVSSFKHTKKERSYDKENLSKNQIFDFLVEQVVNIWLIYFYIRNHCNYGLLFH